MEPVPLQYFNNRLLEFLPLTGGTLTGSLTLAGNAIQPLQPVTLQQLQNNVGLVTVATSPPTQLATQGRLWFDARSAQMFIYYDDGTGGKWVQTNAPVFAGGQPGGNFGGVYYGDTPPDNPNLGNIWIDNSGNIFLWNGTTWLSLFTSGQAGITFGPTAPSSPSLGSLWINLGGQMFVWDGSTWMPTSGITVSDTAPTGASPGNLWWDNVGGCMYIYYDNSWVITDAGGQSGLSN